MKRNYIYIDDDKLENSQAKVRGFNSKYLNVCAEQHKGTWEAQLSYIQKNAPKIDGLILDLGLCDLPNSNSERADFRGTSLAQEIRTETTGADLFDLCIDKDSICVEIFDELSSKLYALAEGYKILADNNHQASDILSNILKVNDKDIDERLISELNKLIGSPTHSLAHFIIHEVLEHKGVLINTSTLAARLGIDVEKSDDWGQLLKILDIAKYKGVFCEGWIRWWMPAIEDWWSTYISNDNLRSMSAINRVSLLKEKLNLSELQAACPIDRAESDAFWTICQGYKRPIDTTDGLLIDGQENLYPWQEPEYVSIDAALRRRNIAEWKDVSVIERDFLAELQRGSVKR